MPRQNLKRGNEEIAAERRVKAWDMRKRGMTFRAIGRVLGINEGNVHRDIHRMLDHLATLETEKAVEYRRIELERLDDMLVGLQAGIEAGDPPSVSAALKVGERRAKLLGLDAPAKQELTGANGGPLTIAPYDLTKLSDDELKQLDDIAARAALT